MLFVLGRVPEVRVGECSFVGDVVIRLGEQEGAAQPHTQALEVVELLVMLAVSIGEVARFPSESIPALARGQADDSRERIPVLGVHSTHHLLARRNREKPEIHPFGLERITAGDAVDDREHFVRPTAAEVKLPALADDSGLEADRVFVVIDRE